MAKIQNSKTWSQAAAQFFGLSLTLASSLLAIRLVLDTSFRMAYPFIPQISEGLNLSISAFSWLLSVRASAGLFGPVIGSFADRHGRRAVMAAALILLSLGLAGTAVSTGWWSLGPMVIMGLAVNAFVP
ncbi:MAG: MFS transporter, partial [Anaerolineales bacterium]|nr:MFS transporter [Anaerolineales bacterium]